VASLLSALGAAFLYAIATLAQHRAAAAVPHGDVGHVALMLQLVRTRGWLLGKLADLGALVLQTFALAHGSLLAVQAVLASGVVITLVMEAGLAGRMLHHRAWLGASAVVVGVVMLVALGDPGDGRPNGTFGGWIAVATLTIGFVVVPGLLESRTSRQVASTLWAVATAACFALDSAFLKNAAGIVQDDGWHRAAWLSILGFIVAATVGNVVIQRAFHLAPLGASIPTLAAAQPVVAGCFGWLLFREALAPGPVARLGGLAGVVVMAGGAILTARTPAAPPGALAVAEEWDQFVPHDEG
jgi:drug/metabolite transporter (DMT)-like permease